VQARCVGGGKGVGDPPTDQTPKDRHRVHEGQGGTPNSRLLQEYWGQRRSCQGVRKVGGEAHTPRGDVANSG